MSCVAGTACAVGAGAAAGVAGGAACVAGAAIAAVVLPPLIKGVAEIIDEEVHDESFSKKKIPIHCNLAASYGSLNHKNINELDDKLKIIIVGTTRAIAGLEDRNWEAIMGCMMQNSMLEPMVGEDICRSEKLYKEGLHFLKFSGKPDPDVVREVMYWFAHNLICDDDVIKDTRIDIETMGKIVAETGARVTGLFSLAYKEEYYEREVVDVGILRYPDLEHPYFKVYRIQLLAWRECDRILIGQKDKSGILGRYNMAKFKPRDKVLDAINEELKAKACQDACTLYNTHFG